MKITDNAAEKIKDFLKAEDKMGLRIRAVPGGCSGMMYEMGLDDNPGTDSVVEISGISIFMDEDTKEAMLEATIDYDSEHDSFHIDNPQFSGCHGCLGCH